MQETDQVGACSLQFIVLLILGQDSPGVLSVSILIIIRHLENEAG